MAISSYDCPPRPPPKSDYHVAQKAMYSVPVNAKPSRPNPFSNHRHSRSLPTRAQALPIAKPLPTPRPALEHSVSATYCGYPDYTLPFGDPSSPCSSQPSLYQEPTSLVESPATPITTESRKPSTPTRSRREDDSAPPTPAKDARYRKPSTTTPTAPKPIQTIHPVHHVEMDDGLPPSLSSSTSSSFSDADPMGQGGYDDGDDYSILDYYGSFGNDKKSQVYASGTSIHDCGESVDMTVGMACDEDEDNWGGFDMPHEGLDDGMAMVAPLKLAPTIKHESTQRQPKRSKPKHKSVKSIAEKEFVTGLAPRPIARDEQEQYVRALLGADVRERAEKEEAERVEAARQLEMDRQRELERLQERELQQQRVREQAVELQARQPGRRSLVEMERQPERGAFERDEWPSVKHNNGHTRGAASENAIANVLLGGNSLAVVAAAESGHVEVTNPNFRFRSLEERRTDRGSTGTSRSGSSSSTSRRSADKKNRLDNLMKLF